MISLFWPWSSQDQGSVFLKGGQLPSEVQETSVEILSGRKFYFLFVAKKNQRYLPTFSNNSNEASNQTWPFSFITRLLHWWQALVFFFQLVFAFLHRICVHSDNLLAFRSIQFSHGFCFSRLEVGGSDRAIIGSPAPPPTAPQAGWRCPSTPFVTASAPPLSPSCGPPVRLPSWAFRIFYYPTQSTNRHRNDSV